jgi:septal ring-binding cell division protein DamX
VSELSHDTAEDGFHEIQLSGKQLVFLFIVTTSLLVAVFLCGVRVGRGARGAGLEEADAAQAAAVPPAPVADAAGPSSADPPTPPPETPDKLTYHDRLEGKGAPDEALKPRAEDAKPRDAANATVERPKPRVEDPKPSTAQTARPQVDAAPAADVPLTGRPGTWVVQVIATRDRSVATSVVKRLAVKGYPAFLVNPPKGSGQPFYKVHVGRYGDRRDAEQVSLRIKKEEQFQPWISR